MATEPIRETRTNGTLDALVRATADAPVGLLLLDAEGHVISANGASLEMLGCSAAEATGYGLSNLFTLEDAAAGIKFDEFVRNGERYSERLSIQTMKGAPLDCDVSFSVIDGLGVLWIRDVSEHVSMQRSLLQAERLSALGEIVAGVAHELNNPLTGILGYAELLLDDETDEKKRKRLDHIVTEAMRCEAIVQSLRGFSSHSGSERGVFSINQIVDNMVTLLEYQMRVDGVTVTRRLCPTNPKVVIDPHGIGRAILNIAHNAHQALQLKSAESREFVVSTEADSDEVRVVFSDNGPGIEAEHLSRIFDPFFTTREFGRGVGLGLSVAYGVVREHGGVIEVESAPGQGATFTIRLPAGDAA